MGADVRYVEDVNEWRNLYTISKFVKENKLILNFSRSDMYKPQS